MSGNCFHDLHALLLKKEWDEYSILCKKWTDEGYSIHKIFTGSLFYFTDEEKMIIIDTLCSKLYYDPTSDLKYVLLGDMINQGCFLSVLYILGLYNNKSHALAKENAYKEAARLEKKAEDSEQNVESDQPYSAFECFLTEYGAPTNINYFWSMYSSRAGYCDIIQGMNITLNDDVIMSAINMHILQ